MTSDEEIFELLYPSLRRFAGVVRPREVDADDLVQEALARSLALQSRAELENPGAYLRTAILRLAANHRRSFGRRRRAITRLSSADVEGAEYPSDLSDLLRLSPRDRAALYLVVLEDQPYAEVAEVLGCREATARMRVSRAMQRLRAELEAERQESRDA